MRGGGFPAANSRPMLRTAAEADPERRSLVARSATAVEVDEAEKEKEEEEDEAERLSPPPKKTSRSPPPSACCCCCCCCSSAAAATAAAAALSTARACSLRPQRSRRALLWACVVTERPLSAWRKVSSWSQRDCGEWRLRIFFFKRERKKAEIEEAKSRKKTRLPLSFPTHLRPGQVAAALCVLRAEKQ